MAVQFGSTCFATAADASGSACAAFSPVVTVQGNIVRTLTCDSVDPVSSALVLHVNDHDIVTGVVTDTFYSQLRAFPSCVQTDYLVAAEVVFSSALALWAIWYGGSKVLALLNWSRGQND